MPSTKTVIVILALSINFISCTDENWAFTKEQKIPKLVHPVQSNGQVFYFTLGSGEPVLTSIGPDYKKCILPQVQSLVTPLGNGKLIFSYGNTGYFKIFDFKNCSTYSLLPIDDGKAYDEMSPYHHGGILETVVGYDDTFDVFDHYQENCMPCRYNDKSERVQVNYPLTPEPTKDYDSYFVERIKYKFGVDKGFIYGAKYNNFTTVLKVLVFDNTLLSQRVFERKIASHSFSYDNFTVCYVLNSCLKGRSRTCHYVECQLLNSELNTVATAKLLQVSDDYDRQNIVNLTVHNLPNGGAMVAMEFNYDWTKQKQSSDVYIQQIHADGRVEPAIKFDSFEREFLYMYGLVFDSGEYCLATAVDLGRDEGYTLIKCINIKS